MPYDEDRQFKQKTNFTIHIDGVSHTGFATCSELKGELAINEVYEGGRAEPYKTFGKLSFPNITLTRPSAEKDNDLHDWWKDAYDAQRGNGKRLSDVKRNLAVVEEDRAGTELNRWNVFGAFPANYTPGSWEAGSDEPVMESIELAIQRWELVPGANP